MIPRTAINEIIALGPAPRAISKVIALGFASYNYYNNRISSL